MPNTSPNPLFYDGALAGDTRRIINGTFAQQLVANTTVVQATNPTATANLMAGVLQPGTLSRVGQSLQITGFGITNLTTTTGALTLTVVLGGVTIATYITGAVAVGALNLPWFMNTIATVASIDSGGNITVEAHGQISQNLTTVAAATTTYNDAIIAVSSSIAAATALTLQIQCIMSGAGNAASFVNQRQLVVTLLN